MMTLEQKKYFASKVNKIWGDTKAVVLMVMDKDGGVNINAHGEQRDVVWMESLLHKQNQEQMTRKGEENAISKA